VIRPANAQFKSAARNGIVAGRPARCIDYGRWQNSDKIVPCRPQKAGLVAMFAGALAMSKSKSPPDHVLHVRTFAELEEYARAFGDGHLNLLIVCGGPGLGKSRCVRSVVKNKACWIDGNATAFGLYLEAYEHRNEPIILDDVDGLYRDRSGIRLLKSLCQSDAVKTLGWQSDSRTLESRNISHRFTTTSRVVMIANQWQSINADVAALEDRAHFLVFEPSAVEVHRQAARWFWDPEIFDFVAEHLHLAHRHSLRAYIQASELKQAGLDWRQAILSRCLTGTALQVAILKTSPVFTFEEERVRAFINSGAGCRATYFKYAKTLQKGQSKPAIQLTHLVPPPLLF
jgi:hypothetical protein